MIYLDHAAATPIDPEVYAAMQPYWSERFYNPSAAYLPAQLVRRDIDAARASIAGWLGARPNEIIFTAGGSEANNLAIQGVLSQFPQASVVVGTLEHESVRMPARQYVCREAAAGPDGIVSPEAIAAVLDDTTVLVSLMYANNEIGTVQPVRKVAALLTEIRAARRRAGNDLPLFFHTDACQAANYLDMHVARLGVDLMTLNGGKLYGPKQSGALFVSSRAQLTPLVWGGGQERGYRSGTENVPLVIGFGQAFDAAQRGREAESRRLHDIQSRAYHLLSECLPAASINGSVKHRLPNNLHITVPGTDNERLLVQLEERGILCAAGSACSASNDEPSHVLRAIGRSTEAAQSSLRLTMGRSTTSEQIDTAIRTIAELAS